MPRHNPSAVFIFEDMSISTFGLSGILLCDVYMFEHRNKKYQILDNLDIFLEISDKYKDDKISYNPIKKEAMN